MDFTENISKREYFYRGLAGFVLFFVLWSLATYSRLVSPLILPTPTEVLSAFVRLWTTFDLLSDIVASFYRVVIGFLTAAIVSIPTGIFIGTKKSFEALTEPLIAFIRYIPPTAFIPLSILWLGIGDVQKFFIIFIGVAPYFLILVADIVSHVKKEYIESAYTLGANRKQIYRYVVIPFALPAIWDAIRFMFGVSWYMIVVAEIVAATSGLGHVIIRSQRFLQTDNIIAVIILIGFLGLGVDYMFKASYKSLFPWSEKLR